MVIGVTGGVGAGKSTILNILREDYSAYILVTDDIARFLMLPEGDSYKLVLKNFGSEILDENLNIDRVKLAGIVFNNPEKLHLLNSCTHPQVVSFVRDQIRKYYSYNAKALIAVETALLFDCGLDKDCDSIWAVITDSKSRLNRLAESRGYTHEKTLRVIENQMSDEELKSRADFIIDNSGSIEETKNQIKRFFEDYDKTK